MFFLRHILVSVSDQNSGLRCIYPTGRSPKEAPNFCPLFPRDISPQYHILETAGNTLVRQYFVSLKTRSAAYVVTDPQIKELHIGTSCISHFSSFFISFAFVGPAWTYSSVCPLLLCIMSTSSQARKFDDMAGEEKFVESADAPSGIDSLTPAEKEALTRRILLKLDIRYAVCFCGSHLL